jgi:hypothetical protein
LIPVEARYELTQKLLLYILPVLAIAGLAVPLVLGLDTFAILGSYMAVPMFFSPFIYKVYRHSSASPLQLEKKRFLLLLNLFIFVYFVSLVLLGTFEIRPYAYYVLVATMASLILFGILLFDLNRIMLIIILAQIMVLVLNMIWGVNLNYFFFIGRTDSTGHAWLIGNLIKNGWVTDVFEMYKPFPLWHILVTSFYVITGIQLPVHRAMFFISGIIYSFMVPVTYLASLYIFKDKKIALLCALFLVIYSDIIFYGMYSISRSVVSFLEVLLILLLLKRDSPEGAFLCIVTVFSLIVFHTASMPFIIVIFLSIWILQKVYGTGTKDLFFTNYFLLLMIVSTVFYWMFFAQDLFKAILSSLLGSAPVGTVAGAVIEFPINELFNYLQYSPILFFALLGTLFALKSDNDLKIGKIFLLVGLLLIPVTFPGPSLLISKLATNFNLARFGEYSFLFILVAAALGFGTLFFRTKKYGKLLLIILFASMSLLSVSNDFVASDNPLVKRPFYTFYLTEEEVSCISHFSNTTEGYLMSDFVTAKFISNSPLDIKEHILEVDTENMTFLRNNSQDLILVRTSELGKRPLNLYASESGKFALDPNTGSSCKYYYRDTPLWGSLAGFNEVFESSQVAGYV